MAIVRLVCDPEIKGIWLTVPIIAVELLIQRQAEHNIARDHDIIADDRVPVLAEVVHHI